jgi:GntR family transcriptional regulator
MMGGMSALRLPDFEIDRSSPVPFYYQLAEQLEQEIASGYWKPGNKLPSELTFCERYGLSRTTVRQVMARLEQRGLIERHKAQGTFVKAGGQGRWLFQSSDSLFLDEIDCVSHRVTSQILRAECGPLPDWACRLLELPVGSSGATLERLRLVDDQVALYVVNHLPKRFEDVALAISDPNESLYQRLREFGAVEPSGGRRTFQAVAAEPWIAELLELEDGAPVANIESVVWDAEMRLFYCYRAFVRTDRIRIDIQSGPTAKTIEPFGRQGLSQVPADDRSDTDTG